MRGRKPNFSTYALAVLGRKSLKAKKTHIGARTHINRLATFFAGLTLREVTDSKWAEYCIWRRAERPGCSLFDDRKHLNSVLLSAYREGLIQRRAHLTSYDERREVGREITPEELGRLYEHAGPVLTFQIEIALKMGLRLREMLHLEWSRIDWDRKMVRLLPQDTKTRRGRVVPINEDLWVRFQARYACRSGPFVFPSRYRKDLPQDQNRRAWDTCRRKAKVKARWHDLRHTCSTRLVRAKVPTALISRILGMSERVLTRIYLHVNDEDLWVAARAMSDGKS